MIKVEKDVNDVPPSLNSVLTQQRRSELIAAGRFIKENKYNSRYKMADIKNHLSAIYRSKCAFCEQKIEQWDVEHFRPKSIYYWLAYSWDNLLLACPTCNGHKNDHFEVLAHKVEYHEEALEDIHSLADLYNEQEQNQLIHPEKETVEEDLFFEKNGEVYSDNGRAQQTIAICKLNRSFLKDERKKLFDDVQNKIKDRFLEYSMGDQEAIAKIKGLIEDFAKDSANINNTYLAFRRYAVKHLLPKVPT